MCSGKKQNQVNTTIIIPLEVFSTVSVDNLKKMVQEKSKQYGVTEHDQLHFFLKRQRLQSNSFLFETLIETLKLKN